MRLPSLPLTIAALIALAACNGDPTIPPERDLRPQLDLVEVGDNCVYGGDDFNTPTQPPAPSHLAEYPINECDLADDGFDDETADFRLVDIPVVNYSGSGIKEVYFVQELRFSSTGAGYRIAAAVFLPLSRQANTGTFGVRLLKELRGAGTIGFLGACPSSITNAMNCAAYAMANGTMHDEPRICIWNEEVGASGSASAYCESKIPSEGGSTDPLVFNRLPVAQFSAAPTTGTSWTFNAGSSTDPEGSTLTYQWQLSDGTTTSPSTSAILNRTFASSGAYSVRLRVTDAQGGVDVKQLSINVCGAPTITTASSLPSATKNVFYSTTFAKSGGCGTASWSIASGSPPTGLSLSGAGTLSGTPTGSGTSNFTIRATDSGGTTTKPFGLTVNVPVTITATITGAWHTIATDEHCTFQSWVQGGSGPITYTWYRSAYGGGTETVVSTSSVYTAAPPHGSGFRVRLVAVRNGQSDSDMMDVSVSGFLNACEPYAP